VVCHCLAFAENDSIILVDAGIRLLDVHNPVTRLGAELIEAAGFQFNEADTAIRRLEALGLRPAHVTDIVLTHGDPDHVGGLADFPGARVHIAAEELANIERGSPRFVQKLFEHGPNWKISAAKSVSWFGLPARSLDLPVTSKVLLVPLHGHTHGHCGVAVETEGGWMLHAGDAYFLREELTEADHPVAGLSAARAQDSEARKASLANLSRIHAEHADAVSMFCYHDISELPEESRPR